MIQTSALDLCYELLSEVDGKELYRLAKSDLEEWKRSYIPKPEYRDDYKAVHLHIVGELVFCKIEEVEKNS